MTGTQGFSRVGLAFLLALLVPNLLGVYGRAVWMLLGVTVLGTGHIGIHLCHRREIRKESNI